MYLKAFYSNYNSKVFLVFENKMEVLTHFEILRNGQVIDFLSKEDLHKPEEFDLDHHTNLFRKNSKYELCYHDESVQMFQTYEYQVKGYQEDKEIISSNLVILKIL